MKTHNYKVQVEWTGNDGQGTKSYRGYRRDHVITAGSKAPVAGSSDPAFRGDPLRYNPEEFLVASLSACHMLWYLHLCSEKGVVVTEYVDEATGVMQDSVDGSGAFTKVTLHPKVRITDGEQVELAQLLHHDAHALCYIARSVHFPVEIEASIAAGEHSR
jgi:organic hydroperoxide reductase OsmC/OhrA